MKKVYVLILIGLLFAASGISHAGKIPVVTTIYPVMDLVRQVGGDRVEVSCMVPAGASPHTFEPRPSDMIRLSKARMFVMIGAGLEFWAEKAIRSSGNKDLKIVVLSDGIPLIYEAHHDDEKGGESRKGASADPHIWLDPLLTKEMIDKIASTLAGLDVSNREYYNVRAENFKRELDHLNSTITRSIRDFRIKEYVTFHSAWNYFSRRYGLRVAGIIEESPGKEASPKHIARVVGAIRQAKARVVFAEPQFNPKTAEVIAREAGARVLFLDPIGGPDIKGRDTYIGLMEYNLSVLEGAMK